MRNDLVLGLTDTRAGLDYFKVMISRVLKDRQYIDDMKKNSEILHTFAISNSTFYDLLVHSTFFEKYELEFRQKFV